MQSFLGLEGPRHTAAQAAVTIVPVPYDATTSFHAGARHAPEAVLRASEHIEEYDEELGREVCECGVHTAAALEPQLDGPEAMVARVRGAVDVWLQAGKRVITLGGDHTVAVGAVWAHAAYHGPLSVLQIDAHADLRDTWEGSRFSHACAARRMGEHEQVIRVVGVGIRALSRAEVALAQGPGHRLFYAKDLAGQDSETWIPEVLASLSERVYVTFDVDGLDPGVLPATGLAPTEAGLLPLPGLLATAEAEPMEASDLSLEQLEARVRELRQQRKRLGPVVPEILQEYRELEERITFLRTQIADLRKAEADLLRLVDELDTLMKRAFRRTFERVHREFQSLFTRLFGGGKARLVLTQDANGQEAGVDIEVRLPGKRTQRLALLSGGERSLTAVALIFALLKVSPTPFCVLDEVDAMLDEANVGRFLEVLHEFSREIQFVVITHHQLTVQAAQVLYGVTLDEDGTSQVLSLKLEDVPAWLEQHAPTPA